MEIKIPPPKNWQDFQSLCLQLWKEIWNDINAEANGRIGQAQHGVDIYGMPAYKNYYAGVQCKDKDSYLAKSKLTEKELEAECEKALLFTPQINEYTIATSAARDANLQQHARQLKKSKNLPFEVTVWSWEDIEEALRAKPLILKSYYQDFKFNFSGVARADLSLITARDQCDAFFSSEEMQRRLPAGFRDFLSSLCYEMSDNAYKHGRASRFSVFCNHAYISFEDDGQPFDPTNQLDSSRVSKESHCGSYLFFAFCEKYKNIMNVQYEQITDGGKKLNKTTFKFNKPIIELGEKTHEILVKISDVLGREGARNLAAKLELPQNQSEIILLIDQCRNMSALVEFVRCIHPRMKNGKYIVSLPQIDYLEKMAEIFNDEKVQIVFRK